MERKECFSSLREITDKNGFTMTESRPECRACQEIRDCLRDSKQAASEKREKDELKRQNMITEVIDLSQINSNELGECLLEFLNRIYSSPMGTVFFRNLLVFLEVPQDGFSSTVTVPISPSTVELILEEVNGNRAVHPGEAGKERGSGEFILRIVLIQKHFSRNKKANMGLIAHEVARLFSSEDGGIRQVLQELSGYENNLFKKMDASQRIGWLMEKWGFRNEFEAFRKEVEAFKGAE
ncbi:MAG: hypothetical protein ABSB22_19175 [Thermodesulfobacteriota bacterium]|jgi:hypothetical protein